uniref:non-specific serine/threonine protein kinase n=1 Tax=Chenopodium quinoa TaxID=63459 RepID=A0A803L8I7_CHEQI
MPIVIRSIMCLSYPILISFILYELLFSIFMLQCSASNCLEYGSAIMDGTINSTLVSPGEVFEFGFFTPDGNHDTRRYLGIWYFNQHNPKVIVWVANRDKPLLEPNGSLLIKHGYAMLLDKKGASYWSTGTSNSPIVSASANFTNILLCLNDNGNLVLSLSRSPERRQLTDILRWQSFDYPTDTFLPEMVVSNLTSWETSNNPAQGKYDFMLQLQGNNQYKLVISKKGSQYYWESKISSPFDQTPQTLFDLLLNDLSSDDYNNSRLVMKFNGQVQFWKLNSQGVWSLNWSEPTDRCNLYKVCGNFGSCNSNNGLVCKCFPGFKPSQPNRWNSGTFSEGCLPRSVPCSRDYNTDLFLRMPMMKVSTPDKNETVENCTAACLADCDCVAYSCGTANCTATSNEMCLRWNNPPTDLQEDYPNGFTIFIRSTLSDIKLTPRDCKPCGTYTIPYPLSTATECGDRLYNNFHCNVETGQVSFLTSNGTFNVTSINPEKMSFFIQVRHGNWCDSRYMDSIVLSHEDPSLYSVKNCTIMKESSFLEAKQSFVEVEMGWKKPSEPACSASSDCQVWPHTTCKVAKNGDRRCICRTNFHWDGYNMRCEKVNFTLKVVAPCLAGALSILLLCGIYFIYHFRKRRLIEQQGSVELKGDDIEGIDVPFFDWESILAATSNFADTYKLGTGGFGSVYMGKLPDGQEIAVKRLSSVSVQGVEEFRTEVKLIAKLQHRNLVRLIGYCVKADEKILVYEYMPNGSLDSCLFDFGIAKIVGGKETEASTMRVVGTYGYMSPEYAYEGIFSVKSDVFSFGVVVLETISGRRNSKIFMFEHGLSLLGHAWKLWNEDKGLELMDANLNESCFPSEVLKCIHIGLLCVQEDPSDRPTMSTVVHMLSGENASLPLAKQPAFMNRKPLSENASSSSAVDSSVHEEMTVSTIGRCCSDYRFVYMGSDGWGFSAVTSVLYMDFGQLMYVGKNYGLFYLLLYVTLYLTGILASASECLEAGSKVIDGTSNNITVSSGGVFELGFFSPDGNNGNTRYLGIWYVSQSNPKVIVWVANRDKPLKESKGSLVIQQGKAELLDGNGLLYWSTTGIPSAQVQTTIPANSTPTFNNSKISNDMSPTALRRCTAYQRCTYGPLKTLTRLCLLDSGNLVLVDRSLSRQENPYLWQSFDHPTDTFLPGMTTDGSVVLSSTTLKLTSWQNHNNPAHRNFTFPLQPSSANVLSIVENNEKGHANYWQSGTTPFDKIPTALSKLWFDGTSPLQNNTRLVINFTGQIQFWIKKSEGWSLNWSEPRDGCSLYDKCGNFGSCNSNNGKICKCLPGFKPSVKWNLGDTSEGCLRRSASFCERDNSLSDIFLTFNMMRVGNKTCSPSSTEANCTTQCLSQCNCVAYSYGLADCSGARTFGEKKCLLWTELTDLQEEYPDGITLFVRTTRSDIDPTSRGCSPCGTYIIPYPLSTGRNCGDPSYFHFHCNSTTSQVIFSTPRGNFNVTSIDQDAKNFTIQVRHSNCDDKYIKLFMSLKDSLPYTFQNCNVVKDQPLIQVKQPFIEVEMSWQPPPEFLCHAPSDCNQFHHTSCKSTNGVEKRCLCRSKFHWDGLKLECTKVPFPLKVAAPCIAGALAIVLLCSIFFVCHARKRRISKKRGSLEFNEDDTAGIDVPFFDWENITAATNNFADANRLGTGGFGSGILPDEQKIAVKRLSTVSVQGVEEFRTEVMLIAKLQHRNLVKLIGYCMKADEKILVYEYMPNGSLDSCLFDFGIARIVGGKETEASTMRVVGTYGYMSPEYALEGIFSVKSDVFGFGVVLLETISGKRNSKIFMFEHGLSLLGHAWKLWNEDKGLELMDSKLNESCSPSEVLKCIHIGLLCVQEDPSDRPTMSTVVHMLSGENASLPLAKQPAFMNRKPLSENASSSSAIDSSVNEEMTVSTIGR